MNLRLAVALLSGLFVGQSYAYDCSNLPTYVDGSSYNTGDRVINNSTAYNCTVGGWCTVGGPYEPGVGWAWRNAWSELGACSTTGNQPPQGAITSPAEGASFQENDSVIIDVDASDSDGQVTTVEFFIDGNTIATDTSAPWSAVWTATPGNHQLSARVEDGGGLDITTAPINISVTSDQPQPPQVNLDTPADGATYNTGDSVQLSASASDIDGSVSSVEFFVDGASIGIDGSAPFALSWTATPGNHSVSATATDNDQLTADSAQVSISVVDLDTPPSVALDSPAGGSVYDENDTVTLSATAADSEGAVSRVEFYVGGQKVGEDSSIPFSYSWTATTGNHAVFARAFDSADQFTDSSPVSITVNGEPVSGAHPCRPDGLYTSPGTSPNYCDIYDTQGREKMGADHPRRIIGYFTSWRNGANGQPSYLVKDIPWDKITHINYAFAHVGSDYSVSVGNTADPDNPATGMEWPGIAGAETDPGYAYKGHFNQLSKFKEQYPAVKTLVSVGGWAETGGHFNEYGDRVADGGFYTMTTNADGSVNYQGIETFANSAVDFIRTYGFDGVDIDYEYPTSMNDAGNPLDFGVANPLRAYLMDSYVELMRVLREKLDAAGEQDNTHYILTIASPSSGYLLRGQETMQISRYLDYVNIMTYDLHGAWNEYVGHNSALYDNGNDPELAAANVYGTSQYGGIGYLNIDWAVKYFRGSMSPGRINIGIPYYTRGWQGVTGGTGEYGEWGLGGSAPLPAQSECPEGTGGASDCGNGALGIDNMWHDLDTSGNEMGAGSNPMWHAKNLENGILGSYLEDYGLDPLNDPQDQLVGTYVRHYDNVSEAPWLWNDSKDVFISTEDEESMDAKVQYVIDQGVGGIMFWELAGDYDWDAAQGEYFMGSTLTSLAYDKFKTAAPYRELRSERPLPAEAVDIQLVVDGFKLGDQNYPLNPKLTITNNTGTTLPGGTVFEFDMPTSTSDTITDQSGAGLTVIESGANAGGGNVGGAEHEFHRVRFSLPSWQNLADGASWDLTLNYYLPVSGPQTYTATINGTTYALAFEHPELPLADLSSGGDGGDGGSGGTGCSAAGVDPSGLVTYPTWPAGDHANGGDRIIHDNDVYEANWWTNSVPGSADGSWDFLCSVD
ncbi:chitinase family 18 [Microbulbifer donghaiensis]|uniref:Chitinase family 18 n=1 Tax=Microbulbifer donghaiensis TaxID=494016 RepID=A0A1M5CAZ5_9GAMM|nr:glycosyl hydrolase family 18 protein [Microbulbifer donghaiensis]SHF51881.1 chitinase family 18 [Microbulbifer donghaiensis]